jgi:hypothetical protein
LEGIAVGFSWENMEHRRVATNAMYGLLALDLIDRASPLDSLLLTKPLQEGFQPLGVYGARDPVESVEPGVGVGLYHGGATKFSWNCPNFDCSAGAIIDCRTDEACEQDSDCGPTQRCNERFCRIRESVCDSTYVNYLRFIQTYLACHN